MVKVSSRPPAVVRTFKLRGQGDAFVDSVYFNRSLGRLIVCRDGPQPVCLSTVTYAVDVAPIDDGVGHLGIGLLADGEESQMCIVRDWPTSGMSCTTLATKEVVARVNNVWRSAAHRSELVTCVWEVSGTRCSSARALTSPSDGPLLGRLRDNEPPVMIRLDEAKVEICQIATTSHPVCAPTRGLERLHDSRLAGMSEALGETRVPVVIMVRHKSVGVCAASLDSMLDFQCTWRELEQPTAALRGFLISPINSLQMEVPYFVEEALQQSDDGRNWSRRAASVRNALLNAAEERGGGVPMTKVIGDNQMYSDPPEPVLYENSATNGYYDAIWSDAYGIYQYDPAKAYRVVDACATCWNNLGTDTQICELRGAVALGAGIGLIAGGSILSVITPGFGWYGFSRAVIFGGGVTAALFGAAVYETCRQTALSRFASCWSSNGC